MSDFEDLAGTERLLEDNDSGEHIKLIPQPTSSPNDPLNWSSWRKYWHASLVLFITALTAAISNDAGAASDPMDEDLGIDYGVQNTAAGVLFVAIACWTLLASPMPWLYGRKIQYLICVLSAVGGSIWFARIETIGDAIWNQMFVGASEACAEALVQLSLSDLFFQHQRGMVLGIYILATSIGTFLGPLIAGYIAHNIGWRWVGWTSAIICGITLIVFIFGLEETAFEREQYIGGRDIVYSSSEKNESFATGGEYNMTQIRSNEVPNSYRQRVAIITPARNVRGTGFKQYITRLINAFRIFYFPAVIYSGIQWGAQDAWLSFYLTIEEDNYYGPPWNYGDYAVAIMNVPTLIGAIIGCFYGGWFSDVFVRWMAKRRGGVAEAEDRLWLMWPSAIINPAGLMLFGICSGEGMPWPAPYVGLAMIGFGWGCAGDLSMAYLMDAYPDMVLEGMVAVAFINNIMACVFTFTSSIWITASGVGNTFIAIGVLSLAFHCLTAPMLYWGKSFRRWTAPSYREYLRIRDA